MDFFPRALKTFFMLSDMTKKETFNNEITTSNRPHLIFFVVFGSTLCQNDAHLI